jgi:hypothetical protein
MNNRYQTIQTDSHLIVVDKDTETKYTNSLLLREFDNALVLDNENSDNRKGEKFFKVIAAYPKIDGVAEFCELPMVDDAEKLADEKYGHACREDESKGIGFITGYKAAKESFGYSEEQVRGLIRQSYSKGISRNPSYCEKEYEDNLIKSLNKTPQFIVEEEFVEDTSKDYIKGKGQPAISQPQIIDDKLIGHWIK